MGKRKTSASRRISTNRKNFQAGISREHRIKPLSPLTASPRNLDVQCVDSNFRNVPEMVEHPRLTGTDLNLDEGLKDGSDRVDVSDDENECGGYLDPGEDDYVIL